MHTKEGKRHKILIQKLISVTKLNLSIVSLDAASILGTHTLEEEKKKKRRQTTTHPVN